MLAISSLPACALLLGRYHVPSVRADAPRMSAATLMPYERCIIEATSEDEVAQCMALMDEVEHSSQVASSTLSELELCIVSAKNEDEVQACISMEADGKLNGYSVDVLPAVTKLGECLARSSGDVEHCIVESERADEHSYG